MKTKDIDGFMAGMRAMADSTRENPDRPS
jgi:hypothetical protein